MNTQKIWHYSAFRSSQLHLQTNHLQIKFLMMYTGEGLFIGSRILEGHPRNILKGCWSRVPGLLYHIMATYRDSLSCDLIGRQLYFEQKNCWEQSNLTAVKAAGTWAANNDHLLVVLLPATNGCSLTTNATPSFSTRDSSRSTKSGMCETNAWKLMLCCDPQISPPKAEVSLIYLVWWKTGISQ